MFFLPASLNDSLYFLLHSEREAHAGLLYLPVSVTMKDIFWRPCQTDNSLDFPSVDKSEPCECEQTEDLNITALWWCLASWLAIVFATVERIQAGLAKLRKSFIILHFAGYI